MPDVRSVKETFQFQAGSSATITVAAVDTAGDPFDVTGLTFTLIPDQGDPVVASTSDPEPGTRVFSLDGADLSGSGVVSIADGNGDEWVVGPFWCSTEGTPRQDHEVGVTVGAAQVALTVSAAIGGGGGGAELSDDPAVPLAEAAAPGTAALAARADHAHPLPDPASIGAATQANIDAAVDAITPDDIGAASIEYVDEAVKDPGAWTLTRDTGTRLRAVRSTRAGRDEIVNDWGFPHYFDGDAGGFLKGTDGVVRHYAIGANVGDVAVTTVEPDDPFAAPRFTVPIGGFPGSGAPNPSATWIGGGPIVDLGDGVGFMVTHSEDYYGGNAAGGDWSYWSLGAAKVVDDGTTQTVTFLGPMIDHEVTPAEAQSADAHLYAFAGHLVVWDDYVYVYHLDFAVPDAGQPKATVSRCALADVVAAIKTETPTVPEFTKWNGETLEEEWTEPATHGSSEALASWLVATVGDFVTLPDGRILWCGVHRDGIGWRIAAAIGTDPLTWDVFYLTDRQDVREWIYTVLWSGDPDSPKHLTSGKALAYFIDADTIAANRWLDHTIEQLDLEPVVAEANVSAFQRAKVLLNVSGAVDLDAEDFPGGVVTIGGAATITLRPGSYGVGNASTVTVVNGSPDTVTVEPSDADDLPINGVGDVTLAPGEIVLLFPITLSGFYLWAGVTYPTTGALSAVALSGDYDDLDNKPTGAWEVIDHRLLSSDANFLEFDLTGYDEIELVWSARCTNSAGSQVPLLCRLNSDDGSNYNVVRSGRVVNTNLLTNTTGATYGELGFVAASQTNTDRWSAGRISLRVDQPAGARKVLTGESSYGQSTGDNMGTAQFGTEWMNTANAITALRLYASSDFVAGSKFTLLGRRFS